MRPGPIRTCIACRQKRPKSLLLRLATIRGESVGIGVGGRGVYVCPSTACVAKLDVRQILRTLRAEGVPVDLEALQRGLLSRIEQTDD